jgi:hypothetical protein
MKIGMQVYPLAYCQGCQMVYFHAKNPNNFEGLGAQKVGVF